MIISSSNANTSGTDISKIDVDKPCMSPFMTSLDTSSDSTYDDKIRFAQASANAKNLSYGGTMNEAITNRSNYTKGNVDNVVASNCKSLGNAVNKLSSLQLLQMKMPFVFGCCCACLWIYAAKQLESV